MNYLEVTYTIGVKVSFLPMYRKFKVVGHRQTPEGGLRLTMPDTSVIVIPEIVKKQFKVFPDYVNAQENLRKVQVTPDGPSPG